LSQQFVYVNLDSELQILREDSATWTGW